MPGRGWRATVRTQRVRLRDALTPSLRREPRTSSPSTEGALRDHGEDPAADALPRTCPYTLDQISGDWLP